MSRAIWLNSLCCYLPANRPQLLKYTPVWELWASMAHTFTPHMTKPLIHSPGRNLIKRVPSNQGGKCLAALNHCAVLYMGDKAPSMLNATGLIAWGTIGNPNAGQFSSRFITCAHLSVGSSGRFKIFLMENELSDACCRGCTVGTSSRLIDAMVGMCFRAVRFTSVKSGILGRQR